MSKKARAVLQRFEGNPILEPVPGHWWESKAVFNPAAIYEDGKVHILYRAIGDSDESVLGYASSVDGFHIDARLDKPVYCSPGFADSGLVPSSVTNYSTSYVLAGNDEEEKIKEVDYVSGGGGLGGCEDPRLTRIDDRVYMTYVAYDGYSPPRVALTSIHIRDFLAKKWLWERSVLISAPGVVDKNACIFSERIESKYVIFHRIYPNILIDFVDDLNFDGKTRWLRGEFKIRPRASYWDSRKVGAGPPPIKTKDGWVLIYHAIGECDSSRYKIGAMLLDLKDPTRVLFRSNAPVLEPQARYENEGWKSGVVYPCGAVVIKDRLLVYYGGADKVTCVASVKLEDFVQQLVNTPVPGAPRFLVIPSPHSLSPSPQLSAYCLKCRTKREMKNARKITMKNGKPAVQGVCPVCGVKMFRIGKA
ncbi:MAG: DUF5679 domain-containing protein [Dehalococcoidales bacterium]|nr:DUF5679 domain-containing protein [Dehalococcoidales bacterium]